MNTYKIAINGFGRIGRDFFRLSLESPHAQHLEVVAINDLGDIDNLAYLLKYDTVYGPLGKEVQVVNREEGTFLQVGEHHILVCSEKDPHDLPWSQLDVDVVVESTGFFTSTEASQAHIDAGAKRVVISAPTKDETVMATPGLGMEHLPDTQISSNASCTTNATNPVAAILHERLGIEKAMLSTVHAYTSTQSLVDGMAKKDVRRGRAAAENIVPSTTGAAKAVAKVIPDLEGVFDGVAIRVPVSAGSLIDMTMLVKQKTSVEEVNTFLQEGAQSHQWAGVLEVTEDPLVSSDILGKRFGSIVSLDLTQVVDGDMVKVMAWYDNEWSYTSMLMKHVEASCECI